MCVCFMLVSLTSILKQHEQLHQSHQNKLKVYSRNRVQSEHFRSSFPSVSLYEFVPYKFEKKHN